MAVVCHLTKYGHSSHDHCRSSQMKNPTTTLLPASQIHQYLSGTVNDTMLKRDERSKDLCSNYMAIRISEIKVPPERDDRSPDSKTDQDKLTCRKIFRVEGDLHAKEIHLLESLCEDVYRSGCPVIIEVDNLCFVDVESARFLCRLKQQWDVEIKGMNLFIKKLMDVAENAEVEDKS